MPRRAIRRSALPGESETTVGVVARPVEARQERVDVLLGAAVRAGREHLDDAHRRAAGDRGPVLRLDAGIAGERSAHSARRFARRAGAGWARPPRPTRTCTARRRAGSRSGAGRRAIARLDRLGAHQDARRELAGVGVDAGVVVVPGVGVVEADAGRDPPAADRQEVAAGPCRRRRPARTAAGRRPGSGRRPASAGRGRASPQRRWWRSTKASRSASGSVDRSRRTSPAASARRSLRRISWRSFLPSVPR